MSTRANDESSPGGKIPDQAVENLLLLWIFAVAWMAASAFIVAPMVRIALKTHDVARLLTLAFPAAGAGLLLWALRRSLRIRKFGSSVLHLNTVPATPGGDLAATIHLDRPVPDDGPMRLRLRCILRKRLSMAGSRTTNTVLWQESHNLDTASSNPGGTDIPVRFHIPADAQASTGFDFNRQILWQLEARGKSGLVNYFARFEVPVGSVPVQEAAAEPHPHAQLRRSGGPDPRAKLREQGIACSPLDDGGLHIHLAAARRKPTVPTVFGLILTAISVALFLAPAPDLTRIVTIALGCIVLLPAAVVDYIAVYLWFVSQDVKAHRGSLALENRALFFRWGRTFDVQEIAEIICLQDGQSSSNNSGVATYHGIQLKTRDGKSTWIASNISQTDYAAWLADEINDALGLSADS